MGAISVDLIHKYTNPQLIFDLVKVAAKTIYITTFLLNFELLQLNLFI
jgi:hypothetical protein